MSFNLVFGDPQIVHVFAPYPELGGPKTSTMSVFPTLSFPQLMLHTDRVLIALFSSSF